MKQATISSWQVVDGLLYGADDFVASWVNGIIDGEARKPEGWHKSIGVLKVNKLVGGAIYHNSQPNDITLSAALDRVFVTPTLLAKIYQYPFKTLDLPRVTVEIPESNARSIRLAKAVNGHLEGRKNYAAPDGGHMLIFGIYRHDFRFKEKING